MNPSPQFMDSSSIIKNTINNDGFKTCKNPRDHQFITLDSLLIFGGRRGDNDMIESPPIINFGLNFFTPLGVISKI